MKQRLAAILAADAAGYSRLMSVPERATVNLSALGHLDEAGHEVAQTRRIMLGLTVAIARELPFRDDEARERYCAALARPGLPD